MLKILNYFFNNGDGLRLCGLQFQDFRLEVWRAGHGGRPDNLAESAVILKHAWRDFDGIRFRFRPGAYARINIINAGALAAAVMFAALFSAAVFVSVSVPIVGTAAVIMPSAVTAAAAVTAASVASVAVAAAAIAAAVMPAFSGLDWSDHDNDRHDQG